MKWLFLIARVRFRLLVKRRYKKRAALMVSEVLQRTSAAIPIRSGCAAFIKYVTRIQAYYRNHALHLEAYVKRMSDIWDKCDIWDISM